ncbi:MAG TPA: hypothetical protein VHE80_01055 [Acidimicrobiales bacterium]|nr:hypothetical protein [Acidimicrobiales bacterium]
MSEQRSTVERLLDVFVYAPIGLALRAREQMPGLVEQGRRRASGQVTVARMVGQLAVNQGQRQAQRWLQETMDRLVQQAPDGPQTGGAATVAEPPPSPPATPGQPAPSPSPSPADLAIPGYDALSASQVVQRLAGLSPQELEAVRAYEAATRARRTVLGRVAQLQSGAV